MIKDKKKEASKQRISLRSSIWIELKHELFSYKILILLATTLVSIIWQHFFTVSDSGSQYFKIMILIFGCIFCIKASSKLSYKENLIINSIVIPLLSFSIIASIFVYVGLLFSFCFSAFTIGISIYIRSKSRILSKTFIIILIPLLYLNYYSCLSMHNVYYLKHLNSEKINKIILVNNNKHMQIEIISKTNISQIVAALGNTYPYSPNHEQIQNPWKMIINDGSENIELTIGKGNKYATENVWINIPGRFAGIYQNITLYNVLVSELDLAIW